MNFMIMDAAACQSFALNTEPQIQTELISAGSVRYVYLPVALWPETLDAAQGAYCAVEQQAFAKWHKNMYETMTEGHSVALERMQSVAQSVGMDVAAFTACVQSGRYRAIPSENSSVAKLEFHPTFFIVKNHWWGFRFSVIPTRGQFCYCIVKKQAIGISHASTYVSTHTPDLSIGYTRYCGSTLSVLIS